MPEFGNSIICEQGFKNVKKDGEIVGFQLRIGISYYRGVPLCLIGGYEIEVDGEQFGNDDIDFSPDGERYFAVSEMGNVQDVRWEYGDKAYLHIKKPGGLTRGLHTIKVTQHVNVPYLPFSTAFYQTKQLTIV